MPDIVLHMNEIPKQATKALLPEDKSVRCGYGWFSLRKGHPFEPACKVHDSIFEAKENKQPTISRREADKQLLRSMLAIADFEQSKWLKAQAVACYVAARLFGRLMW